jgi:5'-methylthioinosine phosphorylase
MKTKLAIIGGTGLTALEGLKITESREIKTEWGKPSSELQFGELNGQSVVFLARHGNPHVIPPHCVNYRANIAALAEVGVDVVIGVNAVGGIRKDMSPASIAIPNQIIDYTWGRAQTFFEKNLDGVTHIDFTDPYSETVRQSLIASAIQVDVDVIGSGVYGATQGPRLETSAEIKRMERDGCDLVGMTGMPEAALAAEKGLKYASLCLVVNWAAGKTEHIITMTEIEDAIDKGMGNVRKLLAHFIGL